jgi:sulfatase maturation enzyme AslB (radical SAM superfamily)
MYGVASAAYLEADAGPGVHMTGQWSGMRGISAIPSYVVMQPTTLCNLDCSYCYLPFRAADQRMPVAVASAVASSIDTFARNGRFSVVWHGGEPLATGRDRLGALLEPFGPTVEHHVQTNATLIDDEWCEFFAEHDMRVSVSVDGPAARNGNRVTRGGRAAYDRIVKGISTLRRHGIPFSALCVVSDPRPGVASQLYDYFLDLGCEVLGINVEELEGVNKRDNRHDWSARGGATPGSTCARSNGPCGTRRRSSTALRTRSCPASSTRSRPSPTTARWCCCRPNWPASTTPATEISPVGTS